jgi:hypothetical protein
VPKTAYRTQGRLGFIALMGPAVNLIPTLGLTAMYPVTGDTFFLQVAWLMALINLGNLSPLYPLDGGLIFNSLLGSVSPHLTAMATWIGVLTGLGLALYLQSNVVGILFLLFALQRYLGGNRTSDLKPLSLVGGTGLALASIATFALYVFVLDFTRTAPAAWAASQLAEAKAEFRRAPTDAELRLAPTADFACPPVGTVFTMSMPLAISAEPVFRNHVSIIGNDRLGCHISSQANGVYWNHAGLVDRGNGRELQVAAENLWPLRVGNTTRANLQYGGHPWSIGFKVASYEKFTARVGTYDAFKIIEIDEYDGKFALEATRWWAPALSYTLSYRREPVTNPNDDQYFEIATINSHAP